MSGFEPNSMLRGAQLTVVGALRALQNPALFTGEHYRQAAIAVSAGIAIRLIVMIPILLVRLLIWFVSLFTNLDAVTWDDQIVGGLDFLANQVLQIPFFLMTLMRFLTPTLDQMFMDSLKWVDQTYIQKHASEDPTTLRAMYYPNLTLYTGQAPKVKKEDKKPVLKATLLVIEKFGRKAAISLGVYCLTFVPVIGRFVLPAASYYTFNKAVGPVPATIIFGSGIFLPKRYLVQFLQAYFSSRSLMRDLLDPYFSRVSFTRDQKRKWFLDREGVLFGFGVGFYIFAKIPLLGVLIYGIAEASTAYLITKITDPPPPPADMETFVESQVTWTNKHEFLNLPLGKLDEHNIVTGRNGEGGGPLGTGVKELQGKKFS